MSDVYNDVWASIIVWLNGLRTDWNAQPIDWEAHNLTQELPNTDLVGPLSIAVTEYDDRMYDVSFAIGVSTYESDDGLFRLRSYVGKIFEAMGSQKQIIYYDSSAALPKSVIQMVPGTLVAPMDKVQIRPFQYVQGSGLLIPTGTAV